MKSDYIRKKLEARKKKFPCEDCQQVFNDLGTLLEHEENHTGSNNVSNENTGKKNIPYRS